MIRAVLFDLDGTLVDTIPLIVASWQHALHEVLGQSRPEAEIREHIGIPLIVRMREIAPDRADDLLASYRAWNLANTERLLAGYAGLDAVLVALRDAGARLGIVTSKMRDAVDLALSLQPPPVAFDVDEGFCVDE